MSISFLVVPVDDRFLEYAHTSGYQLPDGVGHGRWPNLQELRECLASIPDHEVRARGDEKSFTLTAESRTRVPVECEFKTANTDAPETYLSVQGHLEGKPRPLIALHGDYELVVDVVQQLTADCGPQCFFADCEGIPYFVLDRTSEPVGPVQE